MPISFENGFRPGLVIPAAADRLENLELVLESVSHGDEKPLDIVVVCDGWWINQQNEFKSAYDGLEPIKYIHIDKREPGQEQPRNIGVKFLSRACNFVWFLDSDCLVQSDTLTKFRESYEMSPAYQKIMIGPYEWMPPGQTTIDPNIHNDPRWEMFKNTDPRKVFVGSLGVALGCFSGNLVWPLKEFKRVGGFWHILGRGEDGELGIRAAAMSVPMKLVRDARAYHIHHDVNMPWILERNSIDVPRINERHPYVEEQGLVVADRDGKRFNFICKNCDKEINTLESWSHSEECRGIPYL